MADIDSCLAKIEYYTGSIIQLLLCHPTDEFGKNGSTELQRSLIYRETEKKEALKGHRDQHRSYLSRKAQLDVASANKARDQAQRQISNCQT